MQIFIVSMLGCSILIVLLRKVAHRWGMVDRPGGHKRHEHPTPAVGGVAMYVAVVAALLVNNSLQGEVKILLGCAAVLMILGVIDDKRGLSVSMRLIIQVFLVSVVIVGAEGTVTHLGALIGRDVPLGLFAVPFSIVAFVGGINAINMIDGADGMAGKMVLVSMLGVSTIIYVSGAGEFIPLMWAMLGTLVGFLFFNSRLFVKRAWVFMGDSGSMWLGLVLGWSMARLTQDTVSAEPALVLWLFGIPLLDTLAVIIRRLKCKRSPFDPDRTHIHHVLQHNGISVRRSVLALTLAQFTLVLIGVLFYLVKAPSFVVFWSFMLLLAGYYYGLRNYNYSIRQLNMSTDDKPISPDLPGLVWKVPEVAKVLNRMKSRSQEYIRAENSAPEVSRLDGVKLASSAEFKPDTIYDSVRAMSMWSSSSPESSDFSGKDGRP